MAEQPTVHTIRVEVVYATPKKQKLVAMDVPTGTTAAEAIGLAALEQDFEDLEVDYNAIGVFSQKVSPDHILLPGDRVEIYRPLIADPKEIRRQRAKEQG